MGDERSESLPQHRDAPRAIGLIALATALWGTIGVVVALLSRSGSIDPLVLAVARVGLAAPVLWLWYRAATGRWGGVIDRRALGILGAAGFVFAAYHLTYFSAIPRIGLAPAVLLNICSAPLFTVVISRFWLGERMSWRRGGWVVLAVVGSGLLVGGAGGAGRFDAVGVVLAVSAGLCYSTLVVLTRSVAPRFHPVLIQALIMSCAAVVLVLVAAVRQLTVPWVALPWPALVYLAVVPTLLSYVLYTRGLRHVGATTAATLTLLEPLVSTIVAVTWLGEQLTPLSWVGAVVLAVSLVAVTRSE